MPQPHDHYRDVISWSPGILQHGSYLSWGFHFHPSIGVAPDRLVIGVLDVRGSLPRRLKPWKYERLRSATVHQGRVGTTVRMRGRRGWRVDVRLRHQTAEALRTALVAAGVEVTEA